MIDRLTVDRIIDAANIYDVVSDYVTLRRSGASYKGLCPFHDDKTPSFYVNPARNICKCFSCGKGGTAVSFIMEMEQMTYPEALRHLAKKFGIEVKEEELTEQEVKSRGERESMLAVNEFAAKYFQNQLLNTQEGKNIGLAYFRSRGFRDDIIEKFRLGYAPDSWDSLSKEALTKGFKAEFLEKTSLAYRKDNGKLTDKFRGRVMFPWFSLSGQVLAFGGRVLDTRTKGVNQKYINSNDSEIYHKHKELYGLFQAKKQISKEQRVFMVEGYTDVLAMHQCGVENVVANSGTALNDAQINLLKRFTKDITLIYDSDEAGIHAALRGTDMLLEQGMNVKVLLLPEGDDPDSFVRKRSATEFKEYVEQHQTDFIIFKVNSQYKATANDPLKRAEVVDSIINSISLIPDEIVRSTYLHECGQLMDMDEQMLLNRCIQLRERHLEERRKEKEREQHRQALAQNGESSVTQTSEQKANQDDPQQVASQENGQQPLSQVTPQPSQTTPDDSQSPVLQNFPRHLYTDKVTNNILGMEQLIMRTVVRYGERKLALADEEGNVTEISVAQFIDQMLAIDQMHFQNPVYAMMMEDVLKYVENDGFSCADHLLRSPDVNVSQIAADLLNDRYHLDSSVKMEPEENTLEISVPRLILDYKYFVVRKEIQTLKKQLADPQITTDANQLMQVMERYKSLTDVQQQLARQLGDRIVVS